MAISKWFAFGKMLVKNFMKATPNPEKRPAGDNSAPTFKKLPKNQKSNF